MADRVKVLVVGLGNMGASHASAYHRSEGFQIVGIMSRSIKSNTKIPAELAGYPLYEDFDLALKETKPDAVSINSWPNTHAEYALKAIAANCHVFMEKPLATNIEDAEKVVAAARAKNRKLVLGYILRVHPSWIKFIEVGKTLGKPLVMRLNLNQQSSGSAWHWHKNLIDSLIPIVDCGVHYVDVMCQLTGAKPVRVHGIGAKLWAEADKQNYGHLHVTFDDGSVGWYEAGWGPMMSETAYFVKDVVGPKGAVSIVAGQAASTASDAEVSNSADIDRHTKTDALKIHYAQVDGDKNFSKPDEIVSMEDEPGHQELCDREQAFFLRAIREDLDLTEQMDAAVNSLRIVLAAEQSIALGRTVELA
ncbi:gfo/Idh/MocA family oxidoreductase [Mesorhizobium loti]|uniref:Gfo/Idh/MocA family oxidoreductase n=1 Tax=Mesorhizobium jarvisii TaxID=1777867 RepID=A0A6M7TPC6_9HYPH|nr:MULTISPECIES: Gfo/Idh/MocA family oxidoreductase [Mesorhizobium]AID33411.2 gfo/Idh/MocA family oxidoreductase [Mesorhizobium huakuii 7653R]ANN56111.1 oxidoreductase [Mesorhizobium loti NZP2037]MCH4555443.1 Gfo/Idh/MocA family oxidoreductase [Mesorhizobium jarvisii]OBQ76950.1 oxidoreductase [Mesorhizobium loti]QKC66799.1 gfo/Idh/MocA family oxidoreductase [Mesorhizobium jarvisii]